MDEKIVRKSMRSSGNFHETNEDCAIIDGNRDCVTEIEIRESDDHDDVLGTRQSQNEEVEEGEGTREIIDQEKLSKENEEPYTIFTVPEKYFLSLLASFLAIFSSISVPIYLPVLTDLENYFNVSTEKINLTIVCYSIFQGLGPAFWGPLADLIGRRPVYPLCLITYIGANVGLALASNYGMLMGFRCLQAAGMAASVAIGAALVGDITQRRDRGTYMGIFGGLTLVGNGFGPLIGAGLAATWDWRSIFWFLVIAASIALIIVIFALPETNRAFVGNSSVKPEKLINLAPSMVLIHGKKLIPYETAISQGRGMVLPHKKISVFRTFELLANLDVIMILIPSGIHYSAWFVVLTLQSTVLTREYNFTIIQIGISYLANGLGSIIGSIAGGRLLTYYYNNRAATFRAKWAEENGPDSPPDAFHFDIARARLAPGFYLSPIMIGTSIIFAWTIQVHVHWIVPIIMTFFISLTGVTFVNVANTLMVDLFPRDASSASACVNLVRCLLCALFLAVIEKMRQRLNIGGSVTLVSGICALSMIPYLLEYKYGLKWSQKRLEKETKNIAVYS